MPATVPFVCLSIQLCFNYTANVFVITVMLKNEGGASFVPLLYRSKKKLNYFIPLKLLSFGIFHRFLFFIFLMGTNDVFG